MAIYNDHSRDRTQAAPDALGSRWTTYLKKTLAARVGLPFRVLGSRHDDAFGILMYHRVTPHIAGVPTPTYNVTPRRFHAQLSGLLSRGYRAWPLRRVIEYSQNGLPIPRKTFVVTFDDGYENNYHEAWPILESLKIPATIFVATAYLDSAHPFPCDDWTAAGTNRVPVSSWRPLSTAQCVEMHAHGLIEFGSHTHTHADFRNRPQALYQELKTSLDCLRSRLGMNDATFAFPFGTKRLGFSGPVLADAARKAGVLCSLTTEEDLILPASDPFDWGRFTVNESDAAATLAAKLDGWYSFLRGVWRRYRSPRHHFKARGHSSPEPCVSHA